MQQKKRPLSPRMVTPPPLYDRAFLVSALVLVCFGLLMVASASMVISERQYAQPFHYITRQSIFVVVSFVAALLTVRVSIERWQKLSALMLLGSFVLLILVLIPGIGHHVNGSSRWIRLGPVAVQVSELVKLSVVIYLAGYLVRRTEEVRTKVSGFAKPMALLAVISGLLLLEPDFGATAVIMSTAMGMMFLAGVRLWQFLILLGGVSGALGVMIITSPYRLQRLTSFLDPWANPFASGYQLTQSLIAFGRGGWFGVGLGDSVQKLFYLPEAHTDFLFAVLAEELGLLGVLVVIALFVVMVWRGLQIGRRAEKLNNMYAAYVAYGLSLWLGLQAMVNIGVNAGVLPTKGLTLPLMSYGGSSLLVNAVVIGILLRIDFESRSHLG